MILKKISIIDSYIIHDYKELNEKIVKDHISFSYQNKILKLFINIIIHEKIYLINIYYQILIYFNDIYEIVFKISFELYK